MKIIDKTPFFNNDTGEISILDRSKALMKFGADWIKEVEAQRQVIFVLGKVLDRTYTLLRNVTPAGMEASFPLILIGPAGVFVMYVSPLTGMFRAKGDQWGTISGNTYKTEKNNLLVRTERMARAIQVFLQRRGFMELINIEGVLLFSDPSVHVDSVRPIVRVVMRDALERFAISLMQARVVLTPDSVQNIIDRIINTPKPPAPQQGEPQVEASPETPTSAQAEDPYVPAFALPESPAPAASNETSPLPTAETQPISQTSRRKGLTKMQWMFLVAMFIIWCLLISIFLFLVIKDQPSLFTSLLP